jgi:hypothetical protein
MILSACSLACFHLHFRSVFWSFCTVRSSSCVPVPVPLPTENIDKVAFGTCAETRTPSVLAISSRSIGTIEIISVRVFSVA